MATDFDVEKPLHPGPSVADRRLAGEHKWAWGVAVLLAVLLFALAFANGGTGLTARTLVALVAWWTVVAAVVLGVRPLTQTSRASLVPGLALAAYAALTLASATWASSAEDAFTEFNRVTLYLGVFFLATMLGRASLGRLCDGLGIAIAAVALAGVGTRLFPELPSDRGITDSLSDAATRLSFPIGYWNGLAIFLALGFPLLLRLAIEAATPARRAAALASVPMLSVAIYLASSRGGVLAAGIGVAVFVAAAQRRLAAVQAGAFALGGSLLAIAAVSRGGTLINGPLDSAAAIREGRFATLALIVIAGLVVAGSLLGGRLRLVERLSLPRPRGGVVVAATAIALLAVFLFGRPVERFEQFKQPPSAISFSEDDFTKEHLLSGAGSGRWQFWAGAVDEWKSAPLLGRGAGSFEAWWAENGSIAYFIRDAHSLYLEAFGELGVLGGTLALVFVLGGIVVGIGRVRRLRGRDRLAAAALLATFVAYSVGAGVDWMWETTVVTVVAMIALGLLCGPATEPRPRPAALGDDRPSHPGRRSQTLAGGAAIFVISWVVICAQAIPLLGSIKLEDSESAARAGRLADAARAANTARDIQPWASSPYLQLSLVREQTGALEAAEASIFQAISNDREDWRLWLVAARIQTKLGKIGPARQSLARAVSLNPRSPLFEDLAAG